MQQHKAKSRVCSPPSRENTRFPDKAELAKRLNLPNPRTVDYLMAKKLIPVLRLGHRTVRFDWVKVQEALNRIETKAIGQ